MFRRKYNAGKNVKQNVFSAARKLGISADAVRALLTRLGAKPTHSQESNSMMVPYIGCDGDTYRKPTQVVYGEAMHRDITPTMAGEAIMLLKKMAQYPGDDLNAVWANYQAYKKARKVIEENPLGFVRN